MPFVPEWAPNIHPMIVHFPIALLIMAVVFDLFSVIFRSQNWLRFGSAVLFVLGGLAAVATYLTGRQAADSVSVSALANPVLTDHADWALITVWFYGVYAIVKLTSLWVRFFEKTGVSIVVFLIGAAGIFVLFETAEHGAELVYRHGVGVKAASVAPDTTGEPEKAVGDLSGIQESSNGSWRWEPGSRAGKVLSREFNFLQGAVNFLNPGITRDSLKGTVLGFHPQNIPVLFTAGKPLKSIQADLSLNTDSFRGRLFLAHHVQNSLNYHFLELENGEIKLGRLVKGQVRIMDRKAVETMGWIQLRVVGDRTHFRGYVNDQLAVHGHGEEPLAGQVGLFIEGNGTILVDKFSVQSLR